MKPRLNPYVFWPPFLLLLAAVVLNLVNRAWFSRTILALNSAVLSWFGWLFVTIAFACFGLCVWVGVSRFGRVRLGGDAAQSLMSLWNWFAISLCTTIAIGLLFWSTAEPLTHYYHPPVSLGIAPQSGDAQNFALATLFLHWTFVPYSIYCVASILFAYAHYNLKLPFSLGSMLAPLIGIPRATKVGPVVDAVCLYSLVAGMAATLGTGILTISGGLESLWKIPRSELVWGLITLAIVATFIASSATGLMHGIRFLSDINTKGLIFLGLLVFVLGPTWLIIQHGCWAIIQYPWAVLRTGLLEPAIGQDSWSQQFAGCIFGKPGRPDLGQSRLGNFGRRNRLDYGLVCRRGGYSHPLESGRFSRRLPPGLGALVAPESQLDRVDSSAMNARAVPAVK